MSSLGGISVVEEDERVVDSRPKVLTNKWIVQIQHKQATRSPDSHERLGHKPVARRLAFGSMAT